MMQQLVTLRTILLCNGFICIFTKLKRQKTDEINAITSLHLLSVSMTQRTVPALRTAI